MRRYLLSVTVGLCFLACSSYVNEPSAAATYYVAPTGSDSNPGTEDLPFATVQQGIEAADDGDTVFIRNGTYDLELLAATVTENISLIGESREDTIITNGRRLMFQTGFAARNLTFRDFDSTGFDYAVFALYAPEGSSIDGVYLEDLIVENVPSFVYTLDSAGDITNVNIVDCEVSDLNSAWSVNGIYLDTSGTLSDITITGNSLTNVYTTDETRDAFGIVIGSDAHYNDRKVPRPERITIENNTLDGLAGGTEPNIYYDAQARGILVYGDDITINRNTVTNILPPSTAHNAIYIKGSNSHITNNIVHNGGSAKATPDVGSGDITIKGPDNQANVISGNRITSDYDAPGIGIYTTGEVEISNNYLQKTSGYFGIYSYDLAGKSLAIIDNYIEIGANDGVAIRISEADRGEIAYNAVIHYEGEAVFLGSSVNVDVHDNVICEGYDCGVIIPPRPTCQNQGYLCCETCLGDAHPDYDDSCVDGCRCCAACGDTEPVPSPTRTDLPPTAVRNHRHT